MVDSVYSRGWRPVLLTVEHASSAAEAEEFERLIEELPAVSSKEQDVAVLRRWLALLSVGGGLMTNTSCWT